jgi:hypothetical protein
MNCHTTGKDKKSQDFSNKYVLYLLFPANQHRIRQKKSRLTALRRKSRADLRKNAIFDERRTAIFHIFIT